MNDQSNFSDNLSRRNYVRFKSRIIEECGKNVFIDIFLNNGSYFRNFMDFSHMSTSIRRILKPSLTHGALVRF